MGPPEKRTVTHTDDCMSLPHPVTFSQAHMHGTTVSSTGEKHGQDAQTGKGRCAVAALIRSERARTAAPRASGPDLGASIGGFFVASSRVVLTGACPPARTCVRVRAPERAQRTRPGAGGGVVGMLILSCFGCDSHVASAAGSGGGGGERHGALFHLAPVLLCREGKGRRGMREGTDCDGPRPIC